jgi:hypothetical protein
LSCLVVEVAVKLSLVEPRPLRFVYDELVAEHEASEANANNSGKSEIKESWEREVYLSDQVETFKQYLIGQIPWTLMERALGKCDLSFVR